ncbi:MAG TPA: hypothetical protein VKB00_08070, partial [Candidatus Limnocylindrales bacterium]|nr:hypothetical protein [Candidatus Limnocylindrales bacterium]
MRVGTVRSSTLVAALLLAVVALGASAAGAATGHSISGTIWANAPGTPVEGALISACPSSFDTPCKHVSSSADGAYSVPDLPDGDWTLTVSPPASGLGSATLGPIAVLATDVTGQDAILRAPIPPPPGTSVNNTPPGEIPRLVGYGPVNITTTGCDGGLAIWTLTSQYGGSGGGGGLFETSPGTYASDSLLSPLIGPARVKLTILGCPVIEFDVYVVLNDVVRDTFGVGVGGATVTLHRSDDPGGPFVQVPDGSPFMTPLNRTNPDLSDGNGHFGWDALGGYYKVTAEKAGCTDPADGDSVAQSDVLTIPRPSVEPPPFFDTVVVLECGPPNYPPVLLGSTTTIRPFSGVPFSGEVASFSDPDLLESPADFSARIDWRDGTPSETGLVMGDSGSFAVRGGAHTFAVPGLYPVLVVVTETATGATSYGFTLVEVVAPPTNRPPVVAGTTIDATSAIPFSGTIATFDDPDYGEMPADFSASIDWGDGTPLDAASISGGDGSFAVDGTHTYAAPGTYTITVLVTETATGEGGFDVTYAEVAAPPNQLPVAVGTTIGATSGVPFSGRVATFTDADVAETPADFSA